MAENPPYEEVAAYPEPEDYVEEPTFDGPEATALVPAQVRMRRNEMPSQKGKIAVTKPVVAAPKKDEAYEQFMKDMKDLGAV